MIRPVEPRLWLQRALPIVRLLPHTSMAANNKARAVGIFADRVVSLTLPKRTKELPAAAYEPNGGAETLMAMKGAADIIVIPLSAVRSVALERNKLGGVQVAVDAENLTETLRFPAVEEGAHLCRALEYLFGERFFSLNDGKPAPVNVTPFFEREAFPAKTPPRKPDEEAAPRRAPNQGIGLLALGYPLMFWAVAAAAAGPFFFYYMMSSGQTPADSAAYSSSNAPLALLERPLTAAFTGALGLFGKERDTIAVYVTMALWLAIFWGGAALVSRGRRLLLPSLKERLSKDSRAPILYLRSFRDEDIAEKMEIKGRDSSNVPVQIQYGLLYQVIQFVPWFIRFLRGRDSSRLEEHLSWFFGNNGPLVAIGKPGERIATPGAARIYLHDHEWQDFVKNTMARAQAVLLQVSATEGTWWEFENSIHRVAPRRLLLLLTVVQGSQQKYEELRLHAWDILPRPLPRFLGDALFVRFDDDWTLYLLPAVYKPRIVWAWASSIVDFPRSLASFRANLPAPPSAKNGAADSAAYGDADKTLPLRGADIRGSVRLTPDAAANGGKARLTIADRSVIVPFPPHIRTGQEVRLPGEGTPGRNGAGDGSLIVRFEVEGDDPAPAAAKPATPPPPLREGSADNRDGKPVAVGVLAFVSILTVIIPLIVLMNGGGETTGSVVPFFLLAGVALIIITIILAKVWFK